WFDQMLEGAFEVFKDQDLLIEAPSVMCGMHIAEKLNIPFFRAFTMPWTPTNKYPH
ncbi:hypothetical protein CROQUDRAFT_20087, partial [Cronartium quercuum f. sp. fusiforme G11]